MPDSIYILTERLAKLEASVEHRFEGFKSIHQINENHRQEIKDAMEYRLAGMNEFQKRIDRLENTLASKASLETLQRIVYVGLGVLLSAQFIVLIASRIIQF